MWKKTTVKKQVNWRRIWLEQALQVCSCWLDWWLKHSAVGQSFLQADLGSGYPLQILTSNIKGVNAKLTLDQHVRPTYHQINPTTNNASPETTGHATSFNSMRSHHFHGVQGWKKIYMEIKYIYKIKSVHTDITLLVSKVSINPNINWSEHC